MNHSFTQPCHTAKFPDGYRTFIGPQALRHTELRHMNNSFKRFQKSWQTLFTDPYLRDGGNYRQRRYSVFKWQQGKLYTCPHEAHFQARIFNTLHGGIKRNYKGWMQTSQKNTCFQRTVHWAIKKISPQNQLQWRIQAHQFRITTNTLQSGKPTPEGIHKDGADYIMIMLLDRYNVKGGVSQIYTNQHELIDEVTLKDPSDSILLNDHTVWHGVSAIEPEDTTKPAWRDVMVLTFHHQ